ncbi:MAG TPA: non-homologous end-joining DNA ligase [Prosthecobacter sp.]|nr:non-homologous end-joining DNA ligase [Prosthecobacter sp.]
MLALLVETLPEGPEWLYEIKWDGYRAIAAKNGAVVELTSRNQKPLPFSEVMAAVSELKCKSAVIDGEVVALDAQGQISFNLLQNHRSKERTLRFMAFDLLELNGVNLTTIPLEKRRHRLEKLVKNGGMISFSRELPADPAGLMQQAEVMKLEGIIAKRRGSVYEPGERSGRWVKWKAGEKGIFVVGGYTPAGEMIIGKQEKEGLRYVSKLKAGFVPRTRRALMAKLTPLKTPHCPFFNLPETGKGRWGEAMTAAKMEECTWVEPKVRVRVAFVEWTSEKHLRHSKFLGTL